MTAESEDTPDPNPALQQVLEYHEITKHHFQGYARGPGRPVVESSYVPRFTRWNTPTAVS